MIAYLALLLISTLFGGMTLYSFGLAPLVFSAMPAPEAGRFLRVAFPRYYLFIIGVAGAAALLLLVKDSISAMIALDIAILAVFSRQVLTPRINQARDQQLQSVAGAKRKFGQLHGFSVALNMLQLFAAAYLLYRFL